MLDLIQWGQMNDQVIHEVYGSYVPLEIFQQSVN